MGHRASLSPKIPADVAAVFGAVPDAPRARLLALRDLILDTAARTPGAGTLTETLKWGEPSYLTDAPKSGTTVRIAWKPKTPDRVSLLVPCQTSLIEDWRARYTPALAFIGNREIALPLDRPLPRAELGHCIAMALTYHLRKSAP